MLRRCRALERHIGIARERVEASETCCVPADGRAIGDTLRLTARRALGRQEDAERGKKPDEKHENKRRLALLALVQTLAHVTMTREYVFVCRSSAGHDRSPLSVHSENAQKT